MWTPVVGRSQEGEDGRGSGQGFGVCGFKGGTTESWLCDLGQVTQALGIRLLLVKRGQWVVSTQTITSSLKDKCESSA